HRRRHVGRDRPLRGGDVPPRTSRRRLRGLLHVPGLRRPGRDRRRARRPRRDEQPGRPRRCAARARRRDGLSDRPTRTTRVSLAVIGLERPRTVVLLLLAALVLFTMRIGDLSLASLEDAFYAREAVEMARSGRVYTVTWNEVPTHEHPPLHLWLVA